MKQAEQSEPRGWMGTAGYMGIEWKGVCLPNACFAALPGSQSELYPAPPSLPWKHGSKGKGYREAAKFIPIHLIQCLEPWSLYSAFGRGWTKPYMPLNSSLWPSCPSKWGFL